MKSRLILRFLTTAIVLLAMLSFAKPVFATADECRVMADIENSGTDTLGEDEIDQTTFTVAKAYFNLYHWITESYPSNQYPEEYGGEFVKNDRLYIWIVDLSPEYEAKYRKICDCDCLVFLDAKYALNELNSLYSVVSKCSKYYNIAGYCADRVNNCFRIDIAESLQPGDYEHLLALGIPLDYLGYRALSARETEVALREVLTNPVFTYGRRSYSFNWIHDDIDIIDYQIGNRSVSINGGTAAVAYNGNTYLGSFTLGIGGTLTQNGQTYDAFLTAGHCIKVSDTLSATTIKYNGNTISTDFIVQLDFSNPGDYAVLKLQSGYSSTSLFHNGNYSTISANSANFNGFPPVNYTIYRFGQVTGLYSMTVCDVNYTWAYIPVFFEIPGMVCASGPSYTATVSGDSGGPVYCIYQDIYQGVYQNRIDFLGTISGHNVEGSTAYLIYSPIGYVSGFTPNFAN